MNEPKGPWPDPISDHHPAVPEGSAPVTVPPSEQLIDHGVEESFPASDPVAVNITVVPTARDVKDAPRP